MERKNYHTRYVELRRESTDNVITQVENSLADMIWQIMQQDAINKNTCLTTLEQK